MPQRDCMPHERQKYGRSGEEMAAGYLAANGYRIIETNYKNRFGEIDIIAMDDDDTLVFIEVKSRRSDRFGTAGASISRAKQRKISMVALGYLKFKGKMDQKARFDVVAINHYAFDEKGGPVKLIKNAFALAYG